MMKKLESHRALKTCKDSIIWVKMMFCCSMFKAKGERIWAGKIFLVEKCFLYKYEDLSLTDPQRPHKIAEGIVHAYNLSPRLQRPLLELAGPSS